MLMIQMRQDCIGLSLFLLSVAASLLLNATSIVGRLEIFLLISNVVELLLLWPDL